MNNPFPTFDEIQRHYDERASAGHYDVSAFEVFDEYRKDVFRSGFEVLCKHDEKGLKGKAVLDIGCLTGLSLEVMQEHGAVPYGVELQQKAAEVANRKFPGRVKPCDICQTLPFREQFSAVTMTDVLEHLHDPSAALDAVAQSLNIGGLIFITTPNAASPLASILGKHWPSNCPVHHIYLFNPKNVRMLLERHGFRVEQISPLTKRYPLGFVRWVLPNLSQGLAKCFNLVPRFVDRVVLPLRGGEMFVVARKVVEHGNPQGAKYKSVVTTTEQNEGSPAHRGSELP